MKAGKKPKSKTRAKRSRKGPAAGTPSLADLRRELKTSEARFRSLIDTAAVPIVLLSPQLRVLEINAEAERLYGRERADLVGTAYFTSIDPEKRGGMLRADLENVLSGQSLRGVEGKVRDAQGGDRVLLWNARRLMGRAGKPQGIIAVAQDITERQKAEEALREREARLSSIIATAPDAIITIDVHGIVQSFSSAAERMFGYLAGEVIGHNVKMLMPNPHHDAHDAYLHRYLTTGEKRIIGIGREVEAQRKDGSIFPMELAVGEARVGETRIFTGFIRDLTARARMEQELRQAQKMEAVGQLTGGLAHDFNNLLTVITGNLEMLEPKLKGGDERELLSEASEAANLGAQLASRLLAFGRRQPLNPKPVDVSALVVGLTDLLRRSLSATVEIESRLTADLPTAMTDPGQVENALLNLAINARDAMPKGGRLTIETRAMTLDAEEAATQGGLTAGSYVMLSVTDTGTGMSKEVRQRAFEPFFTTKETGRGSGLGLSMVYGFVKQSGGHVQLYSEPGLGTTVRVYLPVIATTTKRKAAKKQAAGPAKGENILVVEDDRLVRRVTVRRLRELGYKVTEVDNPRSALEILDQQPIQLLFTDIIMPGGMSGIDLAREARRRWPELKILFTSGYAEPAAVEQGMMTSSASWLGKPYSARDLAAKLRELLTD